MRVDILISLISNQMRLLELIFDLLLGFASLKELTILSQPFHPQYAPIIDKSSTFDGSEMSSSSWRFVVQ